MRNWNMKYVLVEHGQVTASRLPMRNWNSTIDRCAWRLLQPLPDYLWGIETSLKQCYRLLEQLPDYLWGIETGQLGLDDTTTRYGFQTTYEELKLAKEWEPPPATASRLPMRNWNFLKNGNIQKLRRFQTTYEELKRSKTLTMCWLIRLPDYLWGIETCIPKHTVLRLSLLLPDYLWGIETRLSYKSWAVAIRFQTTYEELKPTPSTALRITSPASRLPMRNWNLLKNENPHQLRRFQTTYEELKQDYLRA